MLALTMLASLAISGNALGAKTMHDPDLALAREFLSALGHHDFETAGNLLDAQVVVDLPYAGNGMTVHGRDDAIDFFKRTMGRSVANLEYRIDRAYPSPQAGALVLEVSTQGRTAEGRDYTNRLVTIFTFRDGRIVLFREYFNPGRVG
jgi:ketosteroid isomerase-like protein